MNEGWITYSHQVGLSGKTVRPKLYIARGIPGSVRRMAGMSRSEIMVAINKDPTPIFGVADISLVGDIYEIVPVLIKRLKELEEMAG